MEFEIYRATESTPVERREIKTIDDLKQISLDYKDGKFGEQNKDWQCPLIELVVRFTPDYREDNVNEIIIYDNYLE
jgi:hypothetical protein